MAWSGRPILVEVDNYGTSWVKSSASGGANGDAQGCVEFTQGKPRTEVRTSRDRAGRHLSFPGRSWRRFVSDLRGS
ncbi:DUF397 domain-containing protein [Actinokineospora enzanensis]|uniref:DUF397 domain-containing protein n=1 Tax=Actinokineospora enzanensis TaxID=155975 RepID=UPI0009FEF4D4